MNDRHSVRTHPLFARLATALVVALSVGVAACGSAPEDSSAPAQAPPAGAGAEATPPDAAAPPGADATVVPPPGYIAPVAGGAPGSEAPPPGDIAPVAAPAGQEAAVLMGAEPVPQSGGQDLGLVASTAKWDKVQQGVRVILAYSPERNAFVGTVENSIKNKLCGVNVTVFLENGTAFGPTKGADLDVGGTAKIELQTQGAIVTKWAVRPGLEPCGMGG